MAGALSVQDHSFEQEVLKSDKVVVVDFWAPWCGPCQMLSPVLEEVAHELSDQVKVVKMNVDENPNTPGEYGISSIPTLILFKKGKAVSVKMGPMPKQKLQDWIKQYTQD